MSGDGPKPLSSNVLIAIMRIQLDCYVMTRNTKHSLFYIFIAVFVLLVTTESRAAVGDQFAKVTITQPDKVQTGRVAFVDAVQGKLIEVDLTGKITWEFSIPGSMLRGGILIAGTDVEWLPKSDHFLLAIANSGVFEVNRQGQTIWEYRTRYADHDVDRLDNGNTLFVTSWDGDSDPIMTEVDSTGKVVFELFARDLELNPADRHGVAGERYSNTHANAVQKLGPNEYLLSLRNFNQFVKVKDGKVIQRINKASNVHDPVPYENGFLFVAYPAEDKSLLVHQVGPGQRRPFFKPDDGTWTPLRTVELLQNGNVLITGGREIGQLDKDGQLVWSLVVEHFRSGKNAQKSGAFIYKAAFVYK
jgi:hypothetical protein